MFTTLLMEEARTRARRNAGVVGDHRCCRERCRVRESAQDSRALLGIGWLAGLVHLLGVTFEEFLQPVPQMIGVVGAGSVVTVPILAVARASPRRRRRGRAGRQATAWLEACAEATVAWARTRSPSAPP